MSTKRKWLASEEDRFIDIWVQNMHLFAPGKRLMETYMELEPHFREVGIEINAQGIKSKMETLKRKYFNLLHSDRDDQSTTWRHFDTMTLVVNGNLKDSKDSEWKDYTQPPKTSHITRSSVYMNDPALREYESPFKSVYVDESAVHFFNHEEKPTAKRTRQRFSKATNVRVKPRRVWQPAEEIIFVDVWEKFSGHIQSDRKKMDVYKDMQNELQQLGLIIVPSDIKSKIESLTRSFRTQRNTVGDKSEWIHYSKISQILNPMDFMKFEAFSEPSGNSSSEEDSAWFKEMGPKTEPEPPGNLTNSNDSVVNQFDSSTQPCSPNSSVDFSLIDPDPSHCKVSIEILDQDESIKPIGSPLSEKQKAAEEFSQFVTKELAVLNDDLLIEAKRQIYNIICVLQMKQNEVNKNL
ncbi:uncharacterized protein LOC108115772 isoform X2 [Drosophila eugracilis]|uniref:uncharacterized protein LOC108115772 isoform X2 n=1 Tax=Drosophila eugracilis TaxID=29029 RepID=UPI001BD92AD9|nr:uncharacterized protein LOC108115772 isoform X2 [Drosophila eugracilis]